VCGKKIVGVEGLRNYFGKCRTYAKKVEVPSIVNYKFTTILPLLKTLIEYTQELISTPKGPLSFWRTNGIFDRYLQVAFLS